MTQSVVQAELASPVRRVWEVLTDLNHQDWRSDIERVEVTGETTFVEYTKGGVATFFTVTRHEPPGYWAFDMENKNYSSVRLSICESGEEDAPNTFPARKVTVSAIPRIIPVFWRGIGLENLSQRPAAVW